MSNNNFISRDHYIPEIYETAEEDKLFNIEEILKDNYDYIYNSIQNEEYKLEHPRCNLFKELLYEDKVVGFVTYDFTIGTGDFTLNEIYVLPEFRGNNYLKNEIDDLLMSGSTVSIYEPTHRVIELLLKYEYADVLDDNLVITAINLDLDVDNIECNVDKSNLNDNMIYACNLYDLNISACILLSDITNDTIIAYSRCLEDDENNYSAKSKREEIDDKYFENIKECLLSNHEKYIEKVMDLYARKPKAEFDIDEIVGRPPHLSRYLEGMIHEEIITKEKALEIQKQMIEEFENEVILPESLLKRLEYLSMEELINENSDMNNFDSELDLTCPYCNFPINPMHQTCDFCGYIVTFEEYNNIVSDDVEKEIISIIEEFKEEGFNDEQILELISLMVDDLNTGSAIDNNIEDMIMDIVLKHLNPIE